MAAFGFFESVLSKIERARRYADSACASRRREKWAMPKAHKARLSVEASPKMPAAARLASTKRTISSEDAPRLTKFVVLDKYFAHKRAAASSSSIRSCDHSQPR